MTAFFVLIRRELGHSLHSLGFYFMLSLIAGLLAWSFASALERSGFDLARAMSQSVSILIFVTSIVPPLLTMRLIAEERHSGSLELLMTAPISDAQVVLAKYVSVVLIYFFFLAPLWLLHVILETLFGAQVDWGQLSAVTCGLLDLALVFLAFGVFCSALASSQIWAGLLATIGTAAILGLGSAYRLLPAESFMRGPLEYASLPLHFQTFASGIVDFRHIVFALSVVFLLLFWTVRILESRKWA